MLAGWSIRALYLASVAMLSSFVFQTLWLSEVFWYVSDLGTVIGWVSSMLLVICGWLLTCKTGFITSDESTWLTLSRFGFLHAGLKTVFATQSGLTSSCIYHEYDRVLAINIELRWYLSRRFEYSAGKCSSFLHEVIFKMS